MFPSTPLRELSIRARLLLLVLLSAAVLSNLYPPTVPLVMVYLPASLFTFLVLRLYGIAWGAVAVVSSALVVPLSVGHPYAVIWYVLEFAFVVWLCPRRKHGNMILSVFFYWVVLGSPLIMLSFYLLGTHPEVGLLISAKNCVNGVANATLACLLVQLLPLQKWFPRQQQRRSFKLSQLLFSLMLGFLMIPAVVMLIGHLQASIAQMETRISEELTTKALALTGQLDLLSEQSLEDQGGLQAASLQQLQKHWSVRDSGRGTWVLTLLSRNRVLVSSSENIRSGSRFNPGRTADLTEVAGGAIHRLPHASSLFMPLADRWRQSSYFKIVEIESVPGWRLVVEKPVKPFLLQLRRSALRIFGLLVLLIGPALALAGWISRRITGPLTTLSQMTRGLPERLKDGTVELQWPEHQIAEISELYRNSQAMASSLQRTFDEIKDARSDLEARVASRTVELYTANAALSRSEQRYFSLAESSPVGIFCVSLRGVCLYANQRWCQMVGISQQQAIQSGWSTYIHLDDQSRVLDGWETMILEQKPFQMEFRIDHPAEGPLWVSCLATPQIDADDNIQDIIGTISDISERVATEQQLRDSEQHLNFLAHHDTLTGLANRLLFRDRLQHAITQAGRSRSRIALFFLDLDRFKAINDSLGHDSGDQLLQTIAQRLTACCRQSDTVARLGGDEFMVMMEQVDDIATVTTLATKILTGLAEPFELDNQHLCSTASIGISLYPDDGGSVDALLKCADAAMYQAKNAGRNNFQFYTSEDNAGKNGFSSREIISP